MVQNENDSKREVDSYKHLHLKKSERAQINNLMMYLNILEK
jgi:hypothetical protein